MAAFTGMGFGSTKFDFHQRADTSGEFARAPAKSPASASCVSFVISAGISFETTEITPRPPSAIERQSQGIIARQHHEIVRHAIQNRRHLRDISGRFLDAHDVRRIRRQALHRQRFDVHARASLHAVKNNRQLNGCRDGLEVLKQTFLRRLVVIRA